jgi:hypothetical protein
MQFFAICNEFDGEKGKERRRNGRQRKRETQIDDVFYRGKRITVFEGSELCSR